MPEDAGVKRILDANFNRAREAARVVEDYARYGLDYAPGAHDLKELRHALQSVWTDIAGQTGALTARAVDSDVGCTDTLQSETERADALAVASAGLARLQQALRSLEEYGKLVDAEATSNIEKLRYRSYDIEQRLLARARPSEKLSQCRFMVLVTAQFTCGRSHAEVAEAALAGGADMVQLREKEMDDGPLLKLSRELRRVTDRHDAMLIINDRPDIAALANADGVHLGRGDLPVADARRIMRSGCVVGSSTHTADEAHAAMSEAADYVALGQIYESPTKDTGRLSGLEYVRWAADNVRVPTLAIGGITSENVGDVLTAGANGVAVCSAVIAAEDIEAAAGAIRERLDEACSR